MDEAAKQSSREIGAKAEKLAAKALKKNGYKILKKNYQTKLGEIDILAKKDNALIIVEVKASKYEGKFGPPEHRVTLQKQRKLKKLAEALLQRYKMESTDVRFDVVAVLLGDGDPQISIIENAFW